ncbi:MAG: hypothetical protein Q8N46_01585 [Anaerolineales bacterium]|nr:hypothetical protein [Anaerolineales bacterium]
MGKTILMANQLQLPCPVSRPRTGTTPREPGLPRPVLEPGLPRENRDYHAPC